MSATATPAISIVLPVWNGERHVAEAVSSVLAQDFTDWELIVVDDGSIDATSAILRGFKDHRVRVLTMPHRGLVPALREGVAHARAGWIARQDADDLSRPARLAAQWAGVRDRPEVVLCHTGCEFIGSGANYIQRAHLPQTMALLAVKLCFSCPIVHSSVLFRKSAYDECGGYCEAERHAEDYALWSRMVATGTVLGLGRRLLAHRLHAESMSVRQAALRVPYSEIVSLRNCRDFLGLDEAGARRAFAVLRQPPGEREWSEWRWFLSFCLPRLRWRSAELCSWLLAQTLRQMFRQRSRKTDVA